MLDASGYYAGGIYEANELRLADPERCLGLNSDDEVQQHDANVSFVPYELQAIVAKYRLRIPHSVFEHQHVFQSICLPKNCTAQDLVQILSYNLVPTAKFNRFIKDVELVNYRVLKLRKDFVTQDDFLIGLG